MRHILERASRIPLRYLAMVIEHASEIASCEAAWTAMLTRTLDAETMLQVLNEWWALSPHDRAPHLPIYRTHAARWLLERNPDVEALYAIVVHGGGDPERVEAARRLLECVGPEDEWMLMSVAKSTFEPYAGIAARRLERSSGRPRLRVIRGGAYTDSECDSSRTDD